MTILNKKTINITFYGEIADENYFMFQEDINDAIKRNYNVRMFLSTCGGSMGEASDLVKIINSFPNDINIYCNEYLLSAGVMMINKITRPIYIGDSCIALIHTPSILLESRGTKKKNSFDSFMQKQEERFTEDYLKDIKHILTEDEIKDIKNGEDVCLNAERTRMLVKNLIVDGGNNVSN